MKRYELGVIIIACALLFSPGAAMAETPAGTVDYSAQLSHGGRIVVEPGNAYIDGKGYEYKNLSIECKEGVDLTIKDLDIDNSICYSNCGITFEGANNRLYLEGSSEITGGWSGAGIRVEGEAELTICGEGSLTAQGGGGCAGIGGNGNENVPRDTALKNNRDCGKIVIESGEIRAAGGYGAAGIGGGAGGDGGAIEIKGGCIHAMSGGDAAAIGGGSGIYEFYPEDCDSEEPESENEPNGKGNAGIIKITGGKVYTAESYETAVGCGTLGQAGRVELSGNANIHLNKTRLGKYEDGHGTANKDVEFVLKGAIIYEYGDVGLVDPNKSDYVENDLCRVTIELGSNGCFTMADGDMHYFDPLYIVDGEGNRREVLCVSGRNVIEVFMPEGRYYIEYYGDPENEYRPALKSEEFEVNGDCEVTPDLYRVSTDFNVYCDGININAVSENGVRPESFDYTVKQGHAVDLELSYDYETQVFVNGEKAGYIYGPVEVRPGKDEIIIEAVSRDGSARNVFTINTTSEMTFRYSAWYWIVLGGGALALVLLAALLRKKLFAKKAAGMAVCVLVSAAIILALFLSFNTPDNRIKLQPPDPSQQNTHKSMSSAFAADGGRIFYTVRNGRTGLRDLYRYDTEKGERVLIAEDASFNIAVSDGKVFFEREKRCEDREENTYSLYCVNTDGSGEQRIAQGGRYISSVFASGGKVYYGAVCCGAEAGAASNILYVYDIRDKSLKSVVMEYDIDVVREMDDGIHVYINTADGVLSYLLDERTNTLIKQDEAVYMELNGYKVVNKSRRQYKIIDEAGNTAAEYTNYWPDSLARYYQYIIYCSGWKLWAFDTNTRETRCLGNLNSEFIEIFEAKDKLYVYFALGYSETDAPEFNDVLLLEEISVEGNGLAVKEVIRHETWDTDSTLKPLTDPEDYYLHG